MKIIDISEENIILLVNFLVGSHRNIRIRKDIERDSIEVTFETEWETKEGTVFIEDWIELSDNEFLSSYPFENDDQRYYLQWLIANNAHMLQKNNPFEVSNEGNFNKRKSTKRERYSC